MEPLSIRLLKKRQTQNSKPFNQWFLIELILPKLYTATQVKF